MPTATRTRSPRLYRYSQLGPKATSAAREWYRSKGWDDCDDLSELLNNELSDEYGVTGCKLYYSLGYCQGDGVAFAGDPDMDEWACHDEELRGLLSEIKGLAALLGFSEPDISVVISHHGLACHWNSMEVSINDYAWEEGAMRESIDAKLEEILRYLEDRVKEISRALEKTGYAHIEYYQSDEYLDALLSGNDDNDYFRWTRSGVHQDAIDKQANFRFCRDVSNCRAGSEVSRQPRKE
jgi:hypothetical protein